MFTWTPRIPNTMKKAQQMRTMFPMGLKDVIRVSTTSFRPGARLITLRNTWSRSHRMNTADYHNCALAERDLWHPYLSGRRVRSRRSTRRIPKIRLPPADAMETRMSTSDTSTSSPSRIFQLLCRYTPCPKYSPMATTWHTQRNTRAHPGNNWRPKLTDLYER